MRKHPPKRKIPGTDIWLPGYIYGVRGRDECQLLYEHASKTDGNIVEIGCQYGKNTAFLCLNFPERTVYAIDFSANGQLEQNDEQPDGVGVAWHARKYPNAVILDTNSQQMDYNSLDGNLTFFFIDADHSYEGVKKDAELVLAYLKSHRGGWVIMHDYYYDDDHPQLAGVRKFVDESIRPFYQVTTPKKTRMAIFEVKPDRPG